MSSSTEGRRRRLRRAVSVTIAAATVTSGLAVTAPAQAAGRPAAPAAATGVSAAIGINAVSPGTARTAARGARWIDRASSWAARHSAGRAGRLRAAAVGGPTSPAAVPAELKAYVADDRTDLQWALRALHAEEAWLASRGEGVVVATVDTGADTAAPDLVGQLEPAVHLDPATDRIVAGYRPDQIGHGTHVAGIIAGKDDGHGITGIAPGAKVLPIDVDTSDELTGAQVGAAITYASTHGAKVVNLSLGFSDIATGAADVRAICAAVKAAVARKVVVVAAAGNDGMGTNTAEAPASCPGAISVAAVDSDLHTTAWSSYDGTVTVAAPGSAIWSTVTTGTSPLGYSAESGTSMAAPFVSGLAALLLAQNPDWTPAQVSARIVATASDVPPAGADPRSGAGVIDPAKALGVSADEPATVPLVTAAADAYASRTDLTGRQIFDQVLLHWVPDPTTPVTGYRVTRWTAAGTTTTDYPSTTVRAIFPGGPAGYQVTALTDDGDAPSSPVWFPLPGQDPTPVYPVTSLKAAWTSKGALTLRWANPRQNAGNADEWAVVVNGEVALSAEKVRIPTSVTVPAAKVPPGDLVISLLVGSSSSLDVAEARASLPARVAFSGTAFAAGSGRYRVDLVLAGSRRSTCGSSQCTGTTVTVNAGGYAHVSRLDNRGHVVVLVSARPRRGTIGVSVSVSGRPAFGVRSLAVPVR